MLYLRVWHRIMVFVLQLDSFSPARRRSHDQCEALSEGEIELDLVAEVAHFFTSLRSACVCICVLFVFVFLCMYRIHICMHYYTVKVWL